MINILSGHNTRERHSVGGGGGGGNQSGGDGIALLDKSNMAYQGSFIPSGSYSGISTDFRGSGIGYYPTNNSLFMTGRFGSYGLAVMEFEVPALLGDAFSLSVTSLPAATHLQSTSFATTDIPDYSLDSDASPSSWFVDDNKLYGSMSEYYDANYNAAASHFVFDSVTLSGASISGLYRIGSLIGGYASGFTYEIPSEHRSKFGGKTHACGKAGGPINSAIGNGPSAIVFNASDLTGSTAVAVNAVNAMYYPHSNPLGGDSDAIYNAVSHVANGAVLNGTNCILFFGDGAVPGDKGYVSVGYGEAAEFNDDNRSGKGFHSLNGDYGFFLWWYNIDDVKSGYDGTLAPYAIQPYHWEYITLPLSRPAAEASGMAYDYTNKRIFLCEAKAGATDEYSRYPLIHVYTHS